MLEAGRAFGSGWASEPLRVQVELVSANPTGPITVAAARNGAYGDAVARLLSFAGHDVEREYYYNDAGTQMERFRVSVEALRRREEPPEDGYRGAYVADLAREDGDPVPRMLDRIEETLARFRIRFDTFEQESAVEAEIPAALAELETYESDGAVWHARVSTATTRITSSSAPTARQRTSRPTRARPAEVPARLRPPRLRPRRRSPPLRRAPRRPLRGARPPTGTVESLIYSSST